MSLEHFPDASHCFFTLETLRADVDVLALANPQRHEFQNRGSINIIDPDLRVNWSKSSDKKRGRTGMQASRVADCHFFFKNLLRGNFKNS